jgi:hypothetical protein
LDCSAHKAHHGKPDAKKVNSKEKNAPKHAAAQSNGEHTLQLTGKKARKQNLMRGSAIVPMSMPEPAASNPQDLPKTRDSLDDCSMVPAKTMSMGGTRSLGAKNDNETLRKKGGLRIQAKKSFQNAPTSAEDGCDNPKGDESIAVLKSPRLQQARENTRENSLAEQVLSGDSVLVASADEADPHNSEQCNRCVFSKSWFCH